MELADHHAGSAALVIELAKSKPHDLNYGSPGTGTPCDMAGKPRKATVMISDLVSRENGVIRPRAEVFSGIRPACSSNLRHDALDCPSIDPDSPWPGSIFDYILIRRFLWLLAQ